MGQHDNAYRDFFSHREMVADLIAAFLPQPWASEVDLESLERVNASYVDRTRRESDVVWRFKLRGEWAYMYLLLEFQASVDPTMALRMVLYQALLVLDLIKARQLPPSGPLPHIFPVVLYNGQRPWTAATEVAALFPPPLPGNEAFALRGGYFLIEERAFAQGALPTTQNLVAALFALETSRTLNDIVRLVRAVTDALRDPGQQSLRDAFSAWLRHVVLPAHFPRERMDATMPLEEVDAMLAERIQQWYREHEEKGLQAGLQQGLEKGLQQGLQQGQRDGEIQLLTKLLTLRFGPLDPEAIQRLEASSPEQRSAWAERLLSAPTLDAVLAPTTDPA